MYKKGFNRKDRITETLGIIAISMENIKVPHGMI